MKKIFVLDTNVLLNEPRAIFTFAEHDVIIPLAVVEEIDNLKTKSSDLGYNARETSRLLEEQRSKGKLNQGVKLANGGILRIVINGNDLEIPKELSSSKMDNRILATALHLQKDNEDKEVILVSDDVNLRLIADVYGLTAEEHHSNRLKDEEVYTGFKEIKVSANLINDFYDKKMLDPKEKKDVEWPELFPHEFIQLTANNKQNNTALAKYDGEMLVPLRYNKQQPAQIKPRNREQQFALELLLDDNIRLVTLSGKAGTGKTLLALAAGLAKVVEEHNFKKLLVARPIMPMGKDIGYLPGDKEDKMSPWMKPIFDNLDFIIQLNKNGKYSFDDLEKNGLLQVEPLTYIRGRSVPDQFIIIDEAQNLSNHEVKTIVTRAGENTKLIFTGDPYQIDNPYLNLRKNGLNFLAHKFHDQEIAGHIMLQQGERSKLARIASEIL